MNTFSILTAQIGMFVIYMLAGVILIRTRVMNRENLSRIAVLDIAGLLFGFSVYMGMLGQVENGEKILKSFQNL